jgi:hypothetical protein
VLRILNFAEDDGVFLQFQNFPFELEFESESESESSLRFTAQVYGQGLRADIALRIAYPLFRGKNDPKMSVFCP